MKTSKGLVPGGEFYLLIWIVVLLGMTLLGVVSAYYLATRVEAAAIPWGLLVPSYVFFALAATGASLANSFFTVFNVKQFKPIVKRGIWLSMTFIVASWIFIILDLGRFYQVYSLYAFFQPHSRLAWMGLLYSTFGLFTLLQLIVVIREENMPKWAPLVMGIIVLGVILGIETNLGALFGAVTAKPLWYSHILPLSFTLSALTAGIALHIVFLSATSFLKTATVPNELRRLFFVDYRPMLMGLIIVNLLLAIAHYMSGLFSNVTLPYVKLLLSGPHSFIFWGLEVVLGAALPLAILLHNRTKRHIAWLVAAAQLVAIGVYFSKYGFIIAGQSIRPLLASEFISYFPHVADVFLVTGGIAVSLLLYTLGELLLPLSSEEKPVWFVFGKRS